MLLELNIRDFAIIDRLQVTLGEGFNALTGETGAGKSIIVDALGAVLGERTGAEYVRSGRPQARVEAVFDVTHTPPDLMALLAEQGIEVDEGTLILSREINASGRTTARINGRTVTTAVLHEVGQYLVDIHGQSEHLSLLRPAGHIELLDQYAGIMAEREVLAALVAELRRLRAELAALERNERELAQRLDLLTFQIEEIEKAAPRVGEEESLEAERTRLANAERLTTLADGAYRALVGAGEVGSRGPRGALDSLREATTQLGDLARLDPSQTAASEALTEIFYTLEEAARDLRAYRDQIEHDPARLEAIDDRLHLLRDLRRKYGATIEEVLAYADEAARELEGLTHREERAAALRGREGELLAAIGERAAVLSTARQAAGERLAAAVETAIHELNMGRARFAVSITQSPDPDGVPLPGTAERCAFDARGVDRVEFLISPNPGEPLKPLARIASGGETARLMLALKSILAAVDATPTLVFDEVDVGVGGRSGQVVGEKLWGLTHDGAHQVICITHLPQIAAFAETHLKISKRQTGDHTSTEVNPLAGPEQVEELAAMLGGLPVTREALANAETMLERIRTWKAERQPSAVSTIA